MTSHIFVALGKWDDVVAANVRARDVQNARAAELGRPPNVCGHYTAWLHYGWLMQGKIEDAERGMDECWKRVFAGGRADEVGYFVNMRARHVLDLENWAAADQLSAEIDRPGYDFVSAFAAIKTGDVATARRLITALEGRDGADQPRRRIATMELDALLALDGGDPDRAVALLEEAAALEEGLPFEFGPPTSLKPPHELLGEAHLQLDNAAEAVTAFRQALDFTPERTTSLKGLAAAADAAGDQATATDARDRLAHIMRNADPGAASHTPGP